MIASEAGLGLIEIMISLTILSVCLLALGGLMFQAAQSTRDSAAVAYRSAALQSAAAWAQGIPWDSLHSPPGGPVGCTTDTAGQLVYNRCATLTDDGDYKTLSVAITPTGLLNANPDTVIVIRNKPEQALPFQ